MSTPDPATTRVAPAIARKETARGALAVVLTGSHARGDASEHSDIDIVALYRTPPDDDASIVIRGGRMVTIARTTAAQVRADFRSPARFTTYVPGWREAVILADSDGMAAKLQARAHRWTWDAVTELADEWVADGITGWAEEALKLRSALDAGRMLHAATQRSLLAIQLAGIMAVRHRILCGTENLLWDLVCHRMGEPWSSAQKRALGLRGESAAVSSEAALELYGLAAREASPLLDRQQRAVVGYACDVAGYPVGDRAG